MKVITLLNRSVIASLLLSASMSVFAGGGGGGPRGPQPGWYPHVSAASTSAPLLAEVDANRVSAPTATASPATTAGAPATGKSRSQVRAELLQAEEAGLVPVHNDYPPSAETIAGNRARFQQIEHAWRADGPLTTSAQ